MLSCVYCESIVCKCVVVCVCLCASVCMCVRVCDNRVYRYFNLVLYFCKQMAIILLLLKAVVFECETIIFI